MKLLAFPIFIGFFLASSLSFAQTDLQKMLEDWAAHPSLKGASMSLSLLDGASGKKIAGINSQKGLSPASSLKIISTAAALDILGSSFQYKTTLAYEGEIDPMGTLKGNLWLIGGGDPSLGADRFEDGDMDAVLATWTRQVRQAGIKKIEGNIIADGNYYQGVRSGRGWPWADVGNYYGAGIWGLNLQENLFYLDFQQSTSRSKMPKLLGHRPLVPYLTLVNELTTGSATSGDQAYIYGGPYNTTRFIRGSLPAGSGKFTIKGSLPDAPFFAAYHLQIALRGAGISSNLATTWLDQPKAKGELSEIGTISSVPLSKLVEAANHESINLYCEAFLRSVAIGERSEVSGVAAIIDWLKRKGISTKGLTLFDGSGLSPQNRIASLTLAQALYQGQSIPSFEKSLPIGNQDGTAKYLFRGEANAHLIAVKSGYIEGVRSYAGFAKSVNGQEFTFSFILNNFNCSQAEARSLLEELMIKLTEVE